MIFAYAYKTAITLKYSAVPNIIMTIAQRMFIRVVVGPMDSEY
jgi:hypothetical protein